MDQNFQTSFIPKKPMIENRVSSRPIGITTIISIFIFFTILIASVGLFFYESYLERTIVKLENDLNLAKGRFEPSKITQLQVLDKRLNAANEILSKHVALSPIFEILQSVTLKSISYTKFSYEYSDNPKDQKIKITMTGLASEYKSIAQQADIFAANKNLIDPVFSNLTLDDKGKVTFDLNFSVDPNFVDYKKVVETANGGDPSSNLGSLN